MRIPIASIFLGAALFTGALTTFAGDLPDVRLTPLVP